MFTLSHCGAFFNRASVRLLTLFCFFLSTWTSIVNAQGVSHSHFFGYTPTPPDDLVPLDVKQYALEMVPNPTTPDEQVLAGTIYRGDSGVYSSIHFLRMDSAGTILTSVEFESDPYDTLYNDHDYIFRSVDIAAGINGSDNVYFVTCLGQKNNSPWAPPFPIPSGVPDQPERDIIRIISTDDNGNLNHVIDIKDNTTSLYPLGYHLEPLNSLLIDRNGQKTLYVCGYAYLSSIYVTQNGITADWYGSKKAFVIAVNVTDAHNMTVIKGMTYDTEPSSVPNTSYGNKDFDIAIRAKEIKYGPFASVTSSTPGIFVTGSGNIQSIGTPTSINRSASLVYVVNTDPGINYLELLQDIRVIPPHISNDGDGEMEYGFDMVEDGVNQKNYIISNKVPKINYASNNYNPYYYYQAMDPDPSGILITEFDQTFSPNLSVGRLYYNGIWGIHSLSSITPTPPSTQYFNFMLAGLMHKDYVSGTTTYSASISDIQPYIFDLGVDFTAVPKNIEYSFTRYNTFSGTGTPGTDWNNYFAYGSQANGSCNIYWNPVFAVRGNTDVNMVYMGTPKWNGALKLKWTRGYAPGLIKYSDNDCSAENVTINTPTTEYYWTFSSTTTDEMVLEESFPNPTTQFIDNVSNGCVPGDVNKTNGIENTGAVQKMSIYPNPASNNINVKVDKSINGNDNIKIELLNPQGQVVSCLYNGPADKASKSYDLASLPSGLYFAKVYVNNVLYYQQKLVIQQ